MSLADSADLRVIISVLYIMTEVIRHEKENEAEDYESVAESFTNEISTQNSL